MKVCITLFIVVSLLAVGALLRPYVEAAVAWLRRKWEAVKKA